MSRWRCIPAFFLAHSCCATLLVHLRRWWFKHSLRCLYRELLRCVNRFICCVWCAAVICETPSCSAFVVFFFFVAPLAIKTLNCSATFLLCKMRAGVEMSRVAPLTLSVCWPQRHLVSCRGVCSSCFIANYTNRTRGSGRFFFL